jgi:hypothetical protein
MKDMQGKLKNTSCYPVKKENVFRDLPKENLPIRKN